jgi:uncharacterized spore protein YtfJ
MKPHHSIKDYYRNFNMEVKFKFKSDKILINKVCKVIPEIFKKISDQTEKEFMDNYKEYKILKRDNQKQWY